jgi:hypothetical protein
MVFSISTFALPLLENNREIHMKFVILVLFLCFSPFVSTVNAISDEKSDISAMLFQPGDLKNSSLNYSAPSADPNMWILEAPEDKWYPEPGTPGVRFQIGHGQTLQIPVDGTLAYLIIELGEIPSLTERDFAGERKGTVYGACFNLGSFFGKTFGDRVMTTSWNHPMSSPRLESGTTDAGAFLEKGNFIYHIFYKCDGKGDFEFLDKKVLASLEKKAEAVIAKRALKTDLETLITNQGIRNSLKVKIEQIEKHLNRAEYQPANNVTKAFLSELAAQRGKHVSEQAYQTLKGFVDAIISSAEFLATAAQIPGPKIVPVPETPEN